MAPIRSYWADNLEANKKTQVITIAQNSGRAQVSEFTRKPAEPLSGSFRQGQFQVWPLTHSDKARRGLLWADVNGDGLPDLLVAEPESGQISIYFQQPDGSLAAPKTFPTLAGVSDLAVADWNGDGKPEIFMLSADERQVGVTRLDEKQRLPFPTLIPLDGKPLALAAGKLQAGAKPVLAVIVEQEGKGDQEGRRLLVIRTADGKTRTQKLSKDFKANPTTLAFHDADQDGLTDLVILMPYEKVKILRQVPGKDFEELDVDPPGGARELAQPWLGTADIDGDGKPELLLTQKNFLRAVVLQREAPLPNSTNCRRMDLHREGTDQRRGQQFAARRRRRHPERDQRHPLALPPGCRTQSAHPLRARQRRRLAGRAQRAVARVRLHQPATHRSWAPARPMPSPSSV